MDAGDLNVILNIVTVLLGGGALGIILKYRLGTKKLSLDSEESIRDHYAQEVAAMRQRLDAKDEQLIRLETYWREMVENSDRRHDECLREREAFRVELSREKQERIADAQRFTDEIAGLKRQISQYSADAMLILENGSKPSTVAPEATESASRVKKIGENGK